MDLTCAYCGCTEGPFHLDHVIPRSRGGPDSPKNLVNSCSVCNMAKGGLLPSEWLDVVPTPVLKIETSLCETLGNTIKQKREWNRKYQQRKRTGAKKRSAYCYFCAGPFQKLKDGFLELCDQETGPPFKAAGHVRFNQHGGREERGSIAYPGNGPQLVELGKWRGYDRMWLFAHANCGPEDPYWINFGQIIDDGVSRWVEHLSKKTWYSWVFYDGLTDAYRAALALRK